MHKLKFSIITVCFNAEKHMEGAIRSVLSQTYPNIEYIVIDGASTDQTLARVERYKDRITKIVSEKDRGIYDAMNKGVRCATGDVVYFLNADDRFFDENAVSGVAQVFESQNSSDLVVGKVVPLNVPDSRLLNKGLLEGRASSRLSVLIDGIGHQRIFARRSLFEKVGVFDLRYIYAADLDWTLRVFNSGARITYVDKAVAYFDVNGFSSRNWQGAIGEIVRVNFKNARLDEFISYFFYVSFRKIKNSFLRILEH